VLNFNRALLLVALLFGSTLSLADSTLEIYGGFGNGGNGTSFSGTITVSISDNVINGITSWNIQIPARGTVPALTFTPSNSVFFSNPLGSVDDPTGWQQVFSSAGAGAEFAFTFGGNGLPLNYLPLGSSTPINVIYYAHNGNAYIGSGFVGPATMAPEPSSLVLVGSGLVGIICFRRKRFGMLPWLAIYSTPHHELR
jgi:hypothetical protein